MRITRVLVLTGLVLLDGCRAVGFAPMYIVNELAPNGTLRAAINYGNTVLAQKDPKTGEARGVSVDLARELAWRLQVPLDVVPYDAAGKATADARNNRWDVAFFAIDPKRAEDVAFTAPYVIIEGVYAVRSDGPIRSNDEVDRAGVRVAVNKGAAYDLFLTRSLKHATLVRAEESFDLFLREGLEAVAGVKQGVVRFVEASPVARLLPGRFMEIQQAMCLPKGREAGAAYLRAFVEEMKASRFVAGAIARAGQEATVAPPAQ